MISSRTRDPIERRDSRRTVEELDDAGLQRVLGADDAEPLVLDQLLEDLRPVAQVVDRGADVGANRSNLVSPAQVASLRPPHMHVIERRRTA